MTTTRSDDRSTRPTGAAVGNACRRGTAVTDGGKRKSSQEQTMKDVAHTPPHGEPANEVWERGDEHKEASDEDEGEADASDSSNRPVADEEP